MDIPSGELHLVNADIGDKRQNSVGNLLIHQDGWLGDFYGSFSLVKAAD